MNQLKKWLKLDTSETDVPDPVIETLDATDKAAKYTAAARKTQLEQLHQDDLITSDNLTKLSQVFCDTDYIKLSINNDIDPFDVVMEALRSKPLPKNATEPSSQVRLSLNTKGEDDDDFRKRVDEIVNAVRCNGHK